MKILIVCASNICRSPYAEYLIKRATTNHSNIEWVKSSAVFNKMKKIHPMAKEALIKEGFSSQEIDMHKPSYIWCDYKRFREADVIIGMTKIQKYLLPVWLWKKYKTLSEVAGEKRKNIKDPYFQKSEEGFFEIMNEIKRYINKYVDKLSM